MVYQQVEFNRDSSSPEFWATFTGIGEGPWNEQQFRVLIHSLNARMVEYPGPQYSLENAESLFPPGTEVGGVEFYFSEWGFVAFAEVYPPE